MKAPVEPANSRAQIVTLTMNPALDITTSVDVVRPAHKLRCATTRYDQAVAGSTWLASRKCWGSVSAMFAAGGPTGALVTSPVKDEGVPFRQVAIAASTRESFTVNETSTGEQ